MIRRSLRAIVLPAAAFLAAALPVAAEAGFPFFANLTRPATGPYKPSVGKYVVVDPAPVGGYGVMSAGECELWQRRDVARPTYPYGWFGAGPHTTQRWTNGGYYDDYVESRTLRGR